MTSSDSFDNDEDDHPHQLPPIQSFDNDGCSGLNPSLSSQSYESTYDVSDVFSEPPPTSEYGPSSNLHRHLNVNGIHLGENIHSTDVGGFGISMPNRDYESPFESYGLEMNGGENACENGTDKIFNSDGPLLLDPIQMQEEGFVRREWQRWDFMDLIIDIDYFLFL